MGGEVVLMETLDVEKANQVCWNVARHVQDTYPDSTLDDLSQQLWLWIVENQAEVLAWDGDEWTARLYRRGFRVCYALARRDRAAAFGYEPQDEYFYSLGALRRLLPLYFEERGPEEDGEFYVPDRDVAVDFEGAFTQLDGATAALLQYVYYGDDPEARTRALAATEACSLEAAQKRVSRALQRLRTALGGPNPYDHPGRAVLSNAQAAAITRRQYGD